MKDWRANFDLAIKTLGIAIALFGVFKYFGDAANARKLAARHAALAYVERYNGAELQKHRQRLFEFWIRNADVLVYIQRNGVSSADYRSFLLVAFEQDPHPRELLDAVYALSSFYDQVALCGAAKVCDAAIISASFCPSSKEFARVYEPVFIQLGELSGTPKFAAGARSLATAC